jgi:hypothetical protein
MKQVARVALLVVVLALIGWRFAGFIVDMSLVGLLLVIVGWHGLRRTKR